MFTWLRRNGTTSTIDDGTGVASLRQTAPGVLCYYAPCPHPSTVELFNARNGAVASYCRRHGRQALREYTRALQMDQTVREIA